MYNNCTYNSVEGDNHVTQSWHTRNKQKKNSEQFASCQPNHNYCFKYLFYLFLFFLIDIFFLLYLGFSRVYKLTLSGLSVRIDFCCQGTIDIAKNKKHIFRITITYNFNKSITFLYSFITDIPLFQSPLAQSSAHTRRMAMSQENSDSTCNII